MLDVIAQNLAAVATVAIAPMPLIALIVLMVAGTRTSAVTWTVGWFTAVAIGFTLATVTGRATPVGEVADNEGVNYLAFVLAGLFLFFALRSFRNRPEPGVDAEEPGWLSSLAGMSPIKVFGLALLMVVINAKNLPIFAAVGSEIAAADLSTSATTITILIFAVIGTSTAIGVLIVALLGGDQAAVRLESWRSWLVQNNAALMSVLFLMLGLGQLGTAIETL